MLPTLNALTTDVVTLKFAPVALAGTVTVAGTVAAAFVLKRLTVTPPIDAGPLKLTAPTDDCPPTTLEGLMLKDSSIADPTGTVL